MKSGVHSGTIEMMSAQQNNAKPIVWKKNASGVEKPGSGEGPQFVDAAASGKTGSESVEADVEVQAESKRPNNGLVISDDSLPKEIGGRDGPEPTRFGDWEKNGRCIDF